MRNPFRSHYTFEEDEKLLAFRFKMLKIMLVLLIVFSLYFAILYSNGIREVVFFEEYARYIHAFIGLVLLMQLNLSRNAYAFVSYAIVIVSILLFAVIMVSVPLDSFRMVWFHLLMVAAFISYGLSLGITSFVLSLISLLVTYALFDLNINSDTMWTIILSLILLFVMLFFYTQQVNRFERDLIKSNETLEKLASHDTLTGILNRRVFLEMSQKYLSQARRKEGKLFFLMLDIDHFKSINDTYGHAEGDNVLKLYTKIISGILRKNDLFGRLGGEEFGVVVIEKDASSALIVAEKLRAAIEAYDFVIEDKKLDLTVSIGLAQCFEGVSLKEIIHFADLAMYEAKESGRNRVVVYEGEV